MVKSIYSNNLRKCNKLLWSFQEVVIDNVKKLVIKKYDSYMILNNLDSIYKAIDKKDFNQQVYYDRVKKLTNYVNEKFKDDNFLKESIICKSQEDNILAQESSLLQLPAEIRSHIFSFIKPWNVKHDFSSSVNKIDLNDYGSLADYIKANDVDIIGEMVIDSYFL